MKPKTSMNARSLTVSGLSVAGVLFGLGDQHGWIALIGTSLLVVMVAVLAMAFNVRIEIDERVEDGHRHRELKVTRRPRRRPSSRRPSTGVELATRRRSCWRRSRARR
jgi:hypothetical protein